jgi:DNA-binding MarR family transcriptional regulator
MAGERTGEIIEHMMALVDQLRSGFEEAVARFELSVAQAKALRYLDNAGPVPMRDLACRLRCDASNVTGIVDRLEQRGLVERHAAPTDRRVKTLLITPAGARLAEEVWAYVLDSAEPVLVMTVDEQFQMLTLLRRLDHGPGGACWLKTDGS